MIKVPFLITVAASILTTSAMAQRIPGDGEGGRPTPGPAVSSPRNPQVGEDSRNHGEPTSIWEHIYLNGLPTDGGYTYTTGGNSQPGGVFVGRPILRPQLPPGGSGGSGGGVTVGNPPPGGGVVGPFGNPQLPPGGSGGSGGGVTVGDPPPGGGVVGPFGNPQLPPGGSGGSGGGGGSSNPTISIGSTGATPRGNRRPFGRPITPPVVVVDGSTGGTPQSTVPGSGRPNRPGRPGIVDENPPGIVINRTPTRVPLQPEASAGSAEMAFLLARGNCRMERPWIITRSGRRVVDPNQPLRRVCEMPIN